LSDFTETRYASSLRFTEAAQWLKSTYFEIQEVLYLEFQSSNRYNLAASELFIFAKNWLRNKKNGNKHYR